MQFEALAKQFALKNLPESEVDISGEVPFEVLAPYRERAITHLAEHMELPGFRPGKVPPATAVQKVGEVGVLEEAAELFIKDFYPELVEAHKLDVVGRPEIKVTKLAPGNPVGLVIRTTLYPEVSVPKTWKFLHEKVALETALPGTDEEVDKTLEDLRQSRKKNDVVPELDDAFAKSVGAFETLDALKEQMKKGITEEKLRRAQSTRRGKLVELLLEQTPLAVPKIFVESELGKIMAQMQEDVQRMGLKFEDYLKHSQKTEEQIRKDFTDQAQKRARLQLILNKLADEESVTADEKEIEAELKHAIEHFPDANPELVRVHIETVLRNEKVLKLLEGAK
ncbi:MAG: trigger factor [Patescibacteria group bacterium]